MLGADITALTAQRPPGFVKVVDWRRVALSRVVTSMFISSLIGISFRCLCGF